MKVLFDNYGVSRYAFNDAETVQQTMRKTIVGSPQKFQILDLNSSNSTIKFYAAIPAGWVPGWVEVNGALQAPPTVLSESQKIAASNAEVRKKIKVEKLGKKANRLAKNNNLAGFSVVQKKLEKLRG